MILKNGGFWRYFSIQINKDLQLLVDLGLTQLQAKIYLSLVQYGNLKVKKISQISKISRPDVYRILSKLLELGLIEKEIVNPIQYRAIPMDAIINILLNRKKMKYENLKSTSDLFLKEFNEKNYSNNKHCNDSNFVLIPPKETIIKKLKNSINQTQESIDIVTSSKRLKNASYYLSDELQNAWKRQILGRAIIEKPEKECFNILKKNWLPWAGIRTILEVPPAIIALYDKKEVFIFIKNDFDLKESPALWSNCPSIITLVEHYFELLWLTGSNLAKIGKKYLSHSKIEEIIS